MTKVVQLTREGFERLQRQLDRENERLIEATGILRETMASGDNFDDTGLEDAKREKGLIEARVEELEDTLARSVLIESPVGIDTITLGATVRLREERSGKELKVQLVSAPEASILEAGIAKVSEDSPLGRQLKGRKANDQFSVELPTNQLNYKVLSIESA